MRNLPFAVLVLFVFSIPWQDVVFLPGNFAISRILGLALIAASLGTLIRGKVLTLRRPSLMLLVTIAFVFWTTLSSLWGESINYGLFSSMIYIQLGVMVWLTWQLCRTQEQHRILLQAFVLGAYVLAGSTVYSYLTNPFVPNSSQSLERYTGIGGNENDIAAIMALALPIAWHLSLIMRSEFLRVVNLIYLPTTVLAVILTASRGGFILVLIGLALIPLTFRYAPRSRKIVVAIALVIMTIAVVRLVPASNFERIAETSSEITEGNVSNRSQVWLAGLEVYAKTPIFGVGVGGFENATFPLLGYRQPAHNAYILILTEMGIVGILIFLTLLVVTLLPLLKLGFPDRPFYLILWFILVVSLFPSNDEDAQHIWTLLALMTTRSAYVLNLARTPETHEPSEGSRLSERSRRRLPTG